MISLAKKWRLPIFLAICLLSTFIMYSFIPANAEYRSNCSTNNDNSMNDEDSTNLKRVKCLIEGSKKLVCLRDNKDVYLPFEKFLKKQFDLTGKLVSKGWFLSIIYLSP